MRPSVKASTVCPAPNGTVAQSEISVRQQGEFWGNFFTPFVYDWNGDGAKDLIIGEGTYACNAVYCLFNTGSKRPA